MSSLDLASLQAPLPAWHPKAWYYGAARFLLGTVGRLSAGIRIGLAHGFDSGVMLDHVYENRAAGTGPLGRLIDRIYLNAPGWAGIRNRGDLLRTKIADTLRHLSADRGEIVLADLACGGGRYVLGALQDVGEDLRVRAILRDYRDENVEKARDNAARLGVAAAVERADAFRTPISAGCRGPTSWSSRASTRSSRTTAWCATTSPRSQGCCRQGAASS